MSTIIFDNGDKLRIKQSDLITIFPGSLLFCVGGHDLFDLGVPERTIGDRIRIVKDGQTTRSSTSPTNAIQTETVL